MGTVSAEVLDSTIIIDHLNGVARATALIDAAESPVISIVTWIEVMTGLLDEGSETRGRRLMAAFELVPLSAEIAEETVRVRRERRLKLPDAIILATARARGLTLVTRNTKDFSIDDPSIRVPYQL